jgi:hypothetical protein
MKTRSFSKKKKSIEKKRFQGGNQKRKREDSIDEPVKTTRFFQKKYGKTHIAPLCFDDHDVVSLEKWNTRTTPFYSLKKNGVIRCYGKDTVMGWFVRGKQRVIPESNEVFTVEENDQFEIFLAENGIAFEHIEVGEGYKRPNFQNMNVNIELQEARTASAIDRMVQRLVQNTIETIPKVNFSSQGQIQTDQIMRFSRALEHNVSLLQLSFSNLPFRIKIEAMEAFSHALDHHQNLKRLTLANVRMGLEHVKMLADMLRSNTVLEEVDFSENDLGEQGIKEIAKALCFNASLKKLYLENNKIKDQGAQAMAKVLLCNPSLQTLSLSLLS